MFTKIFGRPRWWLSAFYAMVTFCPSVFAICIEGECYKGQGTTQFEDGATYSGEWHDGKMHGKGIYKFNGSWIQGIWKNNQLVTIEQKRVINGAKSKVVPLQPFSCLFGNCDEGFGTYQYPDGLYEGNWKDNRRHGSGDHFWIKGGHYSGDWREGLYHGFGFILLENGEKFSGQWRKGLKHGRGIMWKTDGTILSGEWKNGKIVSSTLVTTKPGVAGEIRNRDLLNYIFYATQSTEKSLYRLKNRLAEIGANVAQDGETSADKKGVSDNRRIINCADAKEEVIRIQNALEGRQSLEKLVTRGTESENTEAGTSATSVDRYFTIQDLGEAKNRVHSVCDG